MSENETREITAREESPVSTAPVVSQIMELASRKDINPEMFDKLVAWQEREVARQAEIAYNTAMNAAQAEIQPVVRTTINPQTKSLYAKLEDVDRVIRPIYLRHGFSIEFDTVPPLVEGNIRVAGRCAHRDGHSRMFYREAPADTMGPQGKAVKTILHGGGSTETYLKRYLECGIFNVVFGNRDDDGNRGGAKFIESDQVAELQTLVQAAGRSEEDFMQSFSADTLHHFDELEPGTAFLAAKGALTRMARAKQGPAT